MLRFVAPAGAPVRISEILAAALAAAFGRASSDPCVNGLAAQLEARHAMTMISGRSALAVILRALSRLRPGCKTVAIPAYTCFTVPAAIVRAGFQILPVEIDLESLDFNFEELNELSEQSLLAIVSSNLFGFVNDGASIRSAARERGAFFIDDAAQAMGASRNGIRAGMLGDVGFYSFGRGKALPAMEGALILTNSDSIAAAIQDEICDLPSGSFAHSAWVLTQMLIYSVFIDSHLYWVPNSLPFLKLGATEFEPEFCETRMPAVAQELIRRTCGRLGEFNDIRRANAAWLTNALQGCPAFAVPRIAGGTVANYLRFPLIAPNEALRDQAVRELRAAGIGATAFYPSAVCDIPGIEAHMATPDYHCPAAEDLSRRLLTLPTHAYVTEKDLQTMVATLRKAGSQ